MTFAATVATGKDQGRALPEADVRRVTWSRDVYEPSDDSFALVDAVTAWLTQLPRRAPLPRVCLEIGCGSGFVICSAALGLRHVAAARRARALLDRQQQQQRAGGDACGDGDGAAGGSSGSGTGGSSASGSVVAEGNAAAAAAAAAAPAAAAAAADNSSSSSSRSEGEGEGGGCGLLIATDISAAALAATAQTLADHGVAANAELVRTDLAAALLPRLEGTVDLLLFNPPYVPTPDEELAREGIARAWAGGRLGRRVTDRLLAQLPRLLSPTGRAFIVVVAENRPHEIVEALQRDGLDASIALTRAADEECLQILHVTRRAAPPPPPPASRPGPADGAPGRAS